MVHFSPMLKLRVEAEAAFSFPLSGSYCVFLTFLPRTHSRLAALKKPPVANLKFLQNLAHFPFALAVEKGCSSFSPLPGFPVAGLRTSRDRTFS